MLHPPMMDPPALSEHSPAKPDLCESKGILSIPRETDAWHTLSRFWPS